MVQTLDRRTSHAHHQRYVVFQRMVFEQNVTLSAFADKTIKLWKVHEKKVRKVFSMNSGNGRRKGPAMRSSASLKVTTASQHCIFVGRNVIDAWVYCYHRTHIQIPTLVDMDPIIAASERRCYKNAHCYHVNSISVCSDGQHFISADDLRVNLWNLSRQQSFSS